MSKHSNKVNEQKRDLSNQPAQNTKVLLIMPELFWGGAETQFRMLIENHDRDSFDFQVLIEHSKRDAQDSDKLFIQSNAESVEFCELPDFSSVGRFSRIREIKKFFLKSKAEKPGMIIIYGGISFLLIPWLKSRGYTVCYSDRNAALDNIRQRIKYFFYRKADIVVCNSKATYEARSSVHKNTLFIPNATKIPEHAIESGFKSNNLLALARIARVKNLECAIRSLCFLPDIFTLTIVGDAEDQEYEQELKGLVNELDLKRRVIFKDFTNNVAAEFEDSFCTILPSLNEGMPNAILESWAYGRACIASDVPGNKNIICDPSLLFPCHEPSFLAERVIELKARGKKEYDELCEELRKRALQNFSVPMMVRRYEALIKDIVN